MSLLPRPPRRLRLLLASCILILLVNACLFNPSSPPATSGPSQSATAPVVAGATGSPSGGPTSAASPGASSTAPTSSPPGSNPTMAPTTQPTAGPLTSDEATLQAVANGRTPQRDEYRLTQQFRLSCGQDVPKVVNAQPPNYQVGHKQQFWIENAITHQHSQIMATLQYATAHLYMYVDDRMSVNPTALKRSADRFEQIYNTDRRYFGEEQTLAIDNDPHITVLNTNIPGAGGYFSSADLYPKIVNPFSNERKMIYINLADRGPGSDEYDSALAHEFQHMIHYNQHRHHESWIDEGLAVNAERINKFDPGGVDKQFAVQPDTQLNSWSDQPLANSAHYGAAYLFLGYMAQRAGGDDALREFMATSGEGLDAIDAFLKKKGLGDFNSFWRDFAVALYLNRTDVGDSKWALNGSNVRASTTGQITSASGKQSGTVQQQASDYIELRANAPTVTLNFNGSDRVRVLGNDPPNGKVEWWSNRGDDGESFLTRELDLTAVRQATLKATLWWDHEKDFDYTYFEVSEDNGCTWKTVKGQYTTDTSPSGQNLGNGWTNKSGGGDSASWVDESLDLSPWAGKKVLVRFHTVHDLAVNRPGFAIGKLSIPELNFSDDVTTDNGWQAEGYLRTSNVMPQKWAVQVIKLGKAVGGGRQAVEVEQMNVDASGKGTLTVKGLGTDWDRLILVTSPLAPKTTEVASYEWMVSAG